MNNKITKKFNNKYQSYSEIDQEHIRLEIQQSLSWKFEFPIWNNLLKQYKKANILSIGSSTGSHIMNLIKNNSYVNKLIGCEYNSFFNNIANTKYKDKNHNFYELDVEKKDFIISLKKIMESNKIDSFDIIEISLVLLHLKHPKELLKKLLPFLSSTGSFVITEVDSKLVLSYPPLPKKLYKIYKYNSLGKNRTIGRKLFMWFKQLGLTKISLPLATINNCEYTQEERKRAFESGRWLLKQAEQYAKKYPKNKKYQEHYKYVKENWKAFEKYKLDPNYFVIYSHMLFIAKK